MQARSKGNNRHKENEKRISKQRIQKHTEEPADKHSNNALEPSNKQWGRNRFVTADDNLVASAKLDSHRKVLDSNFLISTLFKNTRAMETAQYRAITRKIFVIWSEAIFERESCRDLVGVFQALCFELGFAFFFVKLQ